MRGRHACALCSRRSRIPVGHCAECGDQRCEKHSKWWADSTVESGGYWLDTRCARRRGQQQAAPAEGA